MVCAWRPASQIACGHRGGWAHHAAPTWQRYSGRQALQNRPTRTSAHKSEWRRSPRCAAGGATRPVRWARGVPCWQRPRAQRRPSEHAGNHSDQHLISPTPPAANPNLLQWGHDAGVPAGCCWCAPCPAGVGNHPAARAGGGAPGVTRWGVETTTILHCACGGSGRQPGAQPSGVRRVCSARQAVRTGALRVCREVRRARRRGRQSYRPELACTNAQCKVQNAG